MRPGWFTCTTVPSSMTKKRPSARSRLPPEGHVYSATTTTEEDDLAGVSALMKAVPTGKKLTAMRVRNRKKPDKTAAAQEGRRSDHEIIDTR